MWKRGIIREGEKERGRNEREGEFVKKIIKNKWEPLLPPSGMGENGIIKLS